MTGPRGLPRILAGLDAGEGPLELRDHERLHGPMPSADGLIELVARSGLRGRGGAGFPTAVKLRAAAREHRAGMLIVNGAETEPASAKDELLLTRLSHLVLDGALLVADAIGAADVAVVVRAGGIDAFRAVGTAIATRPYQRVQIWRQEGGEGFVAGEESAVVRLLGGGPAKPTFVKPRPPQRGRPRRHPVLVQNAETLAHIALIARHGDAWYRELGTEADPGSTLVTVSGAVAAPGVYEIAFGTPIAELVRVAGGASEPLQALLIGGCFGTWVGAETGLGLRLTRAGLQAAGCSLGAGVVVAFGDRGCGLCESARIATWLAEQSTGQCGPCVHGLAAIADSFTALVDGLAGSGEHARILRWCDDVEGRGACHHPTGAVGFVRSALEVFGGELESHHRGRCRYAHERHAA